MNALDEKIARAVLFCCICGHPLTLPRWFVYTCGNVHEGILRLRQEENRRRAERLGKKKLDD